MGAAVAVFDHFSQLLGALDESSAMAESVMNTLREIADDLNLCVFLISHVVKGSKRHGITGADVMRGHGSLVAGADSVFLVAKKTTDWDAVTVKPLALRGAEIEEFGAKFSYQHKEDGSNELFSARFFGEGVTSEAAEIEVIILDTLSKNPGVNQTLLRGLVQSQMPGVGDPMIRRVIARMEQAGTLQVREGKQNAKKYYLGDGND